MKRKITSKHCVLVDACIVIEAHELGLWGVLMSCLKLAIPSIIIRESEHFIGADGWPTEIDVPGYVRAGNVIEMEAALADLADLYNYFDPFFGQSIDEGEAEALALIKAGKAPDAFFCTADGPAIQALAMLGHGEVGVSFERLAAESGCTLPKQARKNLREEFFAKHLKEGRKRRITRAGLR